MYFALIYDLVDDYLERRAPLRPAHLKLAKDLESRGVLVLGGAFADPADRAIIVFHGDDQSIAEDFAKNDPYVKNGLVKKWSVRPWTLVVGSFLPKQ